MPTIWVSVKRDFLKAVPFGTKAPGFLPRKADYFIGHPSAVHAIGIGHDERLMQRVVLQLPVRPATAFIIRGQIAVRIVGESLRWRDYAAVGIAQPPGEFVRVTKIANKLRVVFAIPTAEKSPCIRAQRDCTPPVQQRVCVRRQGWFHPASPYRYRESDL